MRKLMLLAAMLAMVLVAAAPAMAQVEFGDIDGGTDITQTQRSGAFADAIIDANGDVTADDAAAVSNQFGISQDVTSNALQAAAGEDISIDDGDLDDDGILDDFEVVVFFVF